MGYADGGYRRPVWIPIVVGLVLVLIFFRPGSCGRPEQTTREGVERALVGNDATGRLYDTIRRTQPAEFDRLVQLVIDRTRAGAATPEIDQAIIRFLAEAEQRLSPRIAQAPHAQLAAYRAAEIAQLETLQAADPELCGNHLIGQVTRVDDKRVPVSALVNQRVTAWETFAAAEKHPANRKIAEPGGSDWRRIEKAMVAGGTSPASTATMLGGGLAALPGAERCKVAIAFFRAVHSQPPEQADSMYAYIVSRAG